MLAYSGRSREPVPLVAAAAELAGNLGRPATEEDPALPSGDRYKGTCVFVTSWNRRSRLAEWEVFRSRFRPSRQHDH
jgi:hypothetical protein